MNDDYLMAWIGYFVSAAILMLVVWRITLFIKSTDIKTVVRVLFFVLFFTPVPLESGSSFWAPAFMAALIDSVTVSGEAAIARLWPLLGAMLTAVLLSFAWRMFSYKKVSVNNS